MKKAVIVTILLVSGLAFAQGLEDIIEMYESQSDAGINELLLLSTEKGIEIQVTKTVNNKQACFFRAPAKLDSDSGLLVSKFEFTEWDNINHMAWKRTCKVSVDQKGSLANIWEEGRCSQFCKMGSLNTAGLRGW